MNSVLATPDTFLTAFGEIKIEPQMKAYLEGISSNWHRMPWPDFQPATLQEQEGKGDVLRVLFSIGKLAEKQFIAGDSND